ncbi:MAG: TVP38/TMEM64 family protein [Candidatus Omnitrophica bacterium]|nr:TVP38/TMEM64 family protein [Candidatus Omnitrophota bacterium]
MQAFIRPGIAHPIRDSGSKVIFRDRLQTEKRHLDRAIGKSGWRMVLLLRLSPIFPFNVLNYALGLTSITPFQYALASWVGMLPGTILYVYLGSIGESFALEGEWNKGQLALFGAGLVATILITVKATQIVRISMKETRQKT